MTDPPEIGHGIAKVECEEFHGFLCHAARFADRFRDLISLTIYQLWA